MIRKLKSWLRREEVSLTSLAATFSIFAIVFGGGWSLFQEFKKPEPVPVMAGSETYVFTPRKDYENLLEEVDLVNERIKVAKEEERKSLEILLSELNQKLDEARSRLSDQKKRADDLESKLNKINKVMDDFASKLAEKDFLEGQNAIEDVINGKQSYSISASMLTLNRELTKLIIYSDTLSPVERQYWLDTFGKMTVEQKKRLAKILETEHQKLLELELNFLDRVETDLK